MRCGVCCCNEYEDIQVNGEAHFVQIKQISSLVAVEQKEEGPTAQAEPLPPLPDLALGLARQEPPAKEQRQPQPEPALQADTAFRVTEPAPIADTAFRATVTQTRGQSAGITVDLCEGPYLRINQVHTNGSVPDYNASADPEAAIRAGDFIVGVNAVRGSAGQMLMVLQTGGTVELDCRRPQNISLPVLSRAGGHLGVELSPHHPRSASLVVQEVLTSGVIPDWNTIAAGDMQVKKHDYITVVNGKSGDPKELHEGFKRAEKLELVISRPAPG